MAKYEFFLSHKSDDWDDFMREFLADVQDGVGRRAKRAKDEDFVFLDKGEIALGQNWLPRLLDGLQNSSVLLAMYTPRYFGSEWCGREVEFFQRRQAELKLDYPCVIPVLWDIPQEEIPGVVASIQYKDDSLPAAYSEEGMLGLARRKKGRYRDEYVDAVDAIVDAIVRACKQSLPPLPNAPAADSLGTVPSFFHPKSKAGAPMPVVPEPLPPGPASVHFFYLAARSTELQPKKPHLDFYHPGGGEFWRPSPGGSQIKALAAAVAGSKDLNLAYYDQPVDDSLATRLEAARDLNNMVVIFADAWSIDLVEAYRHYAEAYDENIHFNSCMMVVWNDGDPDLNDATRQRLTGTLNRVLRTATTRQEPFYVPRVEGDASVQAQLRQSLERLMHKITEQGTPNRAPAVMQKPILEVHSGTGD